MASFEKARKTNRRSYKERGQIKGRKHLGLLEKHKDYVLRAQDYHKKQKILKHLREKALNRNPDEFYFKMTSSKTKNGVHVIERKNNHTPKELKLMNTQDLNYINSKRAMESKKIEKLQASLHLLADDKDSKPVNQHIVFVDSEKEAKSFDAPSHFETLPELMSRTYNRPKKDTLKNHLFPAPDEGGIKRLKKQRHRRYEELRERIEREKKMKKLSEELELQKNLMGKGRRFKVKTNDNCPPVYKWRQQRKK